MSALRVRRPAGGLRGRVRLPGDRHIGQTALLWAALAQGRSRLRGMNLGADHRQLAAALGGLGVTIEADSDGDVRVTGVGLHGLRMPAGALAAGASVGALRTLSALLAAQHFGTRITAQDEAASTPLTRTLEVLRARGALIAGQASTTGELVAPVSVAPLMNGEHLAPVEIEISTGDADVKAALLITGLYAGGATAIAEGVLTRDHVERSLLALQVPLSTLGPMTMMDTSEQTPAWPGFDWAIPGDFSLACYAMAAALGVPDSDVWLEGVGINRTRTAWLDALRHSGARIDVVPKGETEGGEPYADIRVRSSRLRGLRVLGELTNRLLEDVPALLALSPAMDGRLSLRDAAALRADGRDRLRPWVRTLTTLGLDCTEYDDGVDVQPRQVPVGTLLDVETDFSSAMLGLVLGCAGKPDTIVPAAHRIDALYPGLIESFIALGADVEREGGP